MKRIYTAAFLSVGALLLLCACGQSVPTEGSAQVRPAEGSGADVSMEIPYIGILLQSLDDPYFALIKAGAEDEADARGVQVMVVSPDSDADATAQANMLATMADMAMDVLAVAPIEAEMLTDSLTHAADNEKILIALDTELDFDGCACFMGTDDYDAAYRQGEYAAGLVGSGSYAAILRGTDGNAAQDARAAGLTDALHDSGLHLLDSAVSDSQQAARQETAALLTVHRNLKLICTTSDDAAIGAQLAIKASGRSIRLVAFGGMPEAAELVEQGGIDAAFAQNPYEIGRLCVQNAIRLYQGRTVQRRIFADPVLVTQDSAADYLDSITRHLAHKKTKR